MVGTNKWIGTSGQVVYCPLVLFSNILVRYMGGIFIPRNTVSSGHLHVNMFSSRRSAELVDFNLKNHPRGRILLRVSGAHNAET